MTKQREEKAVPMQIKYEEGKGVIGKQKKKKKKNIAKKRMKTNPLLYDFNGPSKCHSLQFLPLSNCKTEKYFF